MSQPPGFDSEEALRNPYPVYDWLRGHDPVHFHRGQEAWLVTRHADALTVLRDDQTYSARADMSFMDALPPGLREEAEPLREHFGSWIVFSDPPRHTRLRGLVKRYLSPPSVARVKAKLEHRADLLLDDAERAGVFDGLNDYALPLAQLALSELIGVEERELGRAHTWSEQLFEFINVELSEQQTRESLASLLELADFVRDVVARGGREDTLAGALTRAFAEGAVSETEMIATFAQNITGSLGPAPHIISNCLLALLEHPDQLDKLRRNPALARSAVQEALRYDTPFLIIPRTARVETELRGRRIRAGERVGLMIGAANHDPAVFDAPERFVIRSRPNPHLSFGLGSHACLGAHLTQMLAETAIGAVGARFPHMGLAEGVERPAYFGLRIVEKLPISVKAERARGQAAG
jgi:cytochrome P450